jgi:hypothetical protein
MRVLALFVASSTLSSCGSKSTSTSPSSTAGAAIMGSAGSGSATATTAGSGAAATLDPTFAALDAQERHTCGIYARCKVEGLRDDDPQAASKAPTFENACLRVWNARHGREEEDHELRRHRRSMSRAAALLRLDEALTFVM